MRNKCLIVLTLVAFVVTSLAGVAQARSLHVSKRVISGPTQSDSTQPSTPSAGSDSSSTPSSDSESSTNSSSGTDSSTTPSAGSESDSTATTETQTTQAQENLPPANQIETPVVEPLVEYNVKDFGAMGDGLTDDTAAIQAAANAARDAGKTLYIPSGTFYITSLVKLYTSVKCEGKILVPNSMSGNAIQVTRTVPGTTLTSDSLSGLTRGATSINGLSGFSDGTLVFKSTEVLIQRDGYSESGWYTCNEAMQITDANGSIWPALDCTYNDTSKLKATVYPAEDPITINGLSVESTGDTGTVGTLILCMRSNVTFNTIKVNNTSLVGYPDYGFLLSECVNITINNPTIDNFLATDNHPLSYSFCGSYVANITINNANITNAYHAFSGRHVKNVAINGGYWDQVVDCHWGSDFVINGATIKLEVAYAGTNITVKNSTFLNCAALLVIRRDTPEIMGNVIYDNITVQHIGTGQLLGICYPDWSAFGDLGREVKSPDLISVTNVNASLANANRSFRVVVLPYMLAKTNNIAPIGSIVISGIKVDKGTIIEQYSEQLTN